MKTKEETISAVRTLLRRQRVVDLKALYKAVGTLSRMTVFRRLNELGYYSSFSHRGRYYTLQEIPEFDEQGLWFHREIGFSQAGTLKQTAVVQVEQTPEGRTHDELRNLLRVRVHNTLLALVREGRIGRERLGGMYLYVSADAERAAKQLAERRELRVLLAEVFRVPNDEEVIEVLVEALRAAPEIPAPAEVSRRLVARGVRLEPHHVEQVYEEHRLMSGKKRRFPVRSARGAEVSTRSAATALWTEDASVDRGAGHRSRATWSLSGLRRSDDCTEDRATDRSDSSTRPLRGARDTVHACLAKCRWPSGTLVTRRASCLSDVLPPGSNVGYDVMVFVGKERFLHHQQREEIRAALFDQGIDISTGEVSKLSDKFVTYVARLRRARSADLRAVLEGDGGWPLHIDATGEAGRGTVLVVIAGWRGWVLGVWKIATERADLILPCLRQTVRRFSPPCSVMRDLGKAMIPALDDFVSELKLDIPVLACHQHFLADAGKDMLEPAHAELRILFRRTKVRPKLGSLVRDLGRELGVDIEGARQAVLKWQSSAEADHRIDPDRDGMATVRALAQ